MGEPNTNASAATGTADPATAQVPAPTSPESPISAGYASTDLSKELLAKLQDEIKDYKRNKKTSGALLLQSHVAYRAIIDLIKKVDAHGDNLDSLPWEDFEKSAISITELEKFLLDLLFSDHDHESILPDSTKLQESLQFVKTWAAHHTAAVERAEGLTKCVFEDAKLLEETERTGFKHQLVKGQRNDHVDTVESIDKQMQDSTLQETQILRKDFASDTTDYVADVKKAVTSLSAKVKGMTDKLDYPEEQMGKVVAGLMLLHIPFVVSQVKGNDARTDEHIRSDKVWKAAKEFAEYLLGFTEETSDKKEDDLSAEKKTELNTKYNDFEELLAKILDLGGWIPQILTMMRLAAQVRRPFYGRSVALVKMWFTMNKNVEMKNENGVEERKALVSAIGDTTKALTKAKDDITAFNAETMTDKITEVEKSYSSVHATVTLFVKKYAPTDEVALETAYTDAKKVDDEHLQKFYKKVTFKAPATAAADDKATGPDASQATPSEGSK